MSVLVGVNLLLFVVGTWLGAGLAKFKSKFEDWRTPDRAPNSYYS
jgi:hypothetical protein